ncbi:cation diffusion facilitator family transporter [Facklamia miroungae]|uniref:Cation diffusion facilitator family transporter n=1 Tax=Facklamia miroungae TaxID=120956 RepID=A0A1G7SYC0_9LACT|nr:cation diffusion facilitator family transporter [Facklamia miroungae]NKZ29510.1 cation transporter [Facklamia miroungae]SDG27310.1 cation diffusion facilitator family transporter [Facklamia miroungae]
MNNYKIASRGAVIGICVYLMLALIKLITASIFKASSLQADGLNNLSDIIASSAVWIGLHLSKKPADHNHKFGHERYEIISSFIVSLLMFTIGFQVILAGTQQLISKEYSQTSPHVLLATVFSIIVLTLTKSYLKKLAVQSNSVGLKATAKDMQGDLLISISTLLGSLSVTWGFPIVDTFLSIIVGIMIIFSAFEVFKESTFTLSDGFDPETLLTYEKCILTHPDVIAINAIRARMATQQVYLDVTIALDPKMSVQKSHRITEEIEALLQEQFKIKDIDIHVEPYE